MEPQVFAPGGVQGELVVLDVVAAHQDLKAIGGSEPQEICRLLALIPLLVVFQVALTLQLCPDLVEGRFTGSGLHLVEHRFQIGDLLFTLCQQIHQHPGGGLLLFIVLEEVLSVLAGCEPQVQRDGHLFALVVPVGHGDALHALLGQIEVCREQLTVQTQLFALAAGSKLFLTGGLLAHGALVHIVHGLVQLLAFGAQAFRAVLLSVVALQHGVEGGPFLYYILFAVLLRAEEGILDGLSAGVGDAAGRTAGCVLFLQLVDGSHKLALLFLGQLIGGQMFAVKGTPCSFAADHRANTGHGLVEGICHRQISLAGCCHDGRTAHQQEVRSCRLGRRGVGQARQQLAHIAVLKIHALECVNDLAVLHQNQIGVAAHQFGTQGVAHKVAHLVGALKIKIDDAVSRLHVHVQQPAAGEMLAHQHTEGGRRFRVFKAFFGQAHAGGTAAGRKQQRIGIRAGTQGEHQLITGGFK